MKKLLEMRTLTLWLVAVMTTGVAYASYLALRFETMRTGYEVGRERRVHDALEAQHRWLAVEVQSLRERQRVATIATRTLGMAAPKTGRVITVDEVGASRVLGARKAR